MKYALIVFLFLLRPILASEPFSIPYLLEKANANYQQGELAITYDDRRTAFNQAIHWYTLLEQQVKDNGELNRAIGDTYFQINEYSLAILHYYRALKKDPTNSLYQALLQNAQQELGIPSDPPTSKWKERIFCLLPLCSHFFVEISIGLIISTFLVCSFSIWFSYHWLYQFMLTHIVVLILFLTYAVITYYTLPVEGVVVLSSEHYMSLDKERPLLAFSPIFIGEKVRIVQIQENWIKISNLAGQMSYVPISTIQII
jgi:tetratricopeptide (TPR) repeat protein